MRILHVCHQYWPAVGGAERYMTELSEEMASRGHEVDVFTSRSTDYMTWDNGLPAYERIRGVNVYRFASLRRRNYTWRALDFGLKGYARSRRRFYEPFVFFGNGPISPAIAAGLLRRVHHYDLVHIASLHYAHAWTAFRAAGLRNTPVCLTPLVHIGQPQTYDIGYMRRMLSDSNTVFAVTDAERRMLKADGLCQRAMVTGSGLRLERHPPVDHSEARARFGLSEDAFVVLFLGRKTEYKGLDSCIQAVTELRSRGTNAILLAVGPETEYSERLWQRRGQMEGLVVKGTVSDADRLAALAACDVLALPSIGESFGIVYLEAWAYAKPVVGANIAAVASLIDDDINGFLVDARDIGQFVQRLATLSSQPDLGRRLGENGHEKLRTRYTWARIGDIVEGAYRRTLRNHASANGVAACT
jgi:glycosyltransferase involved in cell wall biosynthesis